MSAASDGFGSRQGGDAASDRSSSPVPVSGAGTPPQKFALPDVAPDVASACSKYASVVCEWHKSCGPASFSITYHDVIDCQQQTDGLCRSRLSLKGVGDTSINRDACTAAVTGRTCSDLSPPQPAACRNVPGTFALGASCVGDQCKAGLYCHIPNDSPCGSCRAEVPDGELCGLTINHSGCKPGSVCRAAVPGSGGPLKCIPTAKDGDACGGIAGVICESGTLCLTGRCVSIRTRKVGAACTGGGECDSLEGSCNLLTRRCEALRIVALGEPCGSLGDGSSLVVNCIAGTSCVSSVGALVRTCTADLPLGTACDRRNGSRCARPGHCNDGICRLVTWPVCP